MAPGPMIAVIPEILNPVSRDRRLRMSHKQPAVYMLASKRNGTLYIGVTSDLVKRAEEHRSNAVEGFTRRYGVHSLVWYELHEDMASAIRREKRMKEWPRRWKLEFIEKANPEWQDLYRSII